MCREHGLNRRDFLQLSAALAGLGALPLTQEPAWGWASRPLRIGYLPITDATPLLIAHQRGLFEAEGLQVETPRLFRSWAQLVEAFVSRRVDLVHVLAPVMIWLRYSSSVRAKIVAWNHTGGSALTVRPAITELSQLAGQTVAIPFWYSVHNVLLQYLLRGVGLKAVSRPVASAREVQLLVMAPADMLPALAIGAIAGFIVAEPFNALAEEKGIGRVLRFSHDVWKQHACCVLAMHEPDLSERPAWAQQVVNAVVRAQLWAREHRLESAQILARSGAAHYTPHSETTLRKVLAPGAAGAPHYRDSGALRRRASGMERIDFQPYPFPSYTETLVTLLQQTEFGHPNRFLATLAPKQVAAELVDERFVRQAIQTVGGLGRFGLPEAFERREVIGT